MATPASPLYCVQRYRPDREATSKEIQLLQQHFRGQIHDLHLEGKLRFQVTPQLISYHFLYYPLGLPVLRLYARYKIIHLYTSLCDRPYLPFLNQKNMVITSPNFVSAERIKSKIAYLQKVRQIIVQSEVEKKELLAAGLTKEKISIIYPPVDLEQFSYREPPARFTILNASCPGKARDLRKRGIYFLLGFDQDLDDEQVKFLWRGGEFSVFLKEIRKRPFRHMRIENQIHKDMNEQYAQVHCTIIPYQQFDEYLKLVPTSVIESLAAGKPVLVSSQTGVAEIIRKEACGVVFEPVQKSFLVALAELRKNYWRYQKNCRTTAEKYFSQEQFLKKHEQVYTGLMAP